MTDRWVGIPAQREGLGPDGRRWCRGPCGGEVGPGRRAWCGDACLTEAWIMAGDSKVVRREVFKRDRGICALCGDDTGVLERLLEALDRKAFGSEEHGEAQRDAWEAICLVKAQQPQAYLGARHGWEADHIVPVAEGGAGCGLDGYRTLCRTCHGKQTGALRRRLNEKAKWQPRLG